VVSALSDTTTRRPPIVRRWPTPYRFGIRWCGG